MVFFLGTSVFITLIISVYIFNPKKQKKKFLFTIFFLLFSSSIIYEIKGNKKSLTFTKYLNNEILRTENPDIREIVFFLENRLKNEPYDLEGWLILARTCFLSGHIQKADLYYKKALEFFPESEKALYEYAILKKNSGQLFSAKNFLEKIKKINPNNFSSRRELAEILILLNLLEEAKLEISEIKKLKSLDTNWLEEIEKKINSR